MTNKELAEKLGISAAALSLIINHKPGVSDKTRNNILEKLTTMGYESLIKPVSTDDTKNIGFIIYKKHGKILDLHPFFLLLMETIETYTRKLGYHIILFTFDERQPINEQIDYLEKLQLKGAILFATEMEIEDTVSFKKVNFPIVALDNAFPNAPLTTIAIDNRMGTFQSIKRLTDVGITRIGYLKSTTRVSSFNEREEYYQKALKYFDNYFNPEDIIEVDYTEEGSYRDFIAFLKTNRSLPGAFVCDDDTIASGALRALHENGYNVPNDLSIIGFNNRPSTTITTPPLTSIEVPKNALAISAVDELVRIIEQEFPYYTKKVRIGTSLIEHQSVLGFNF